MVIIGFEDSDGKPVVKTAEEKEKFLKECGFKKEEVMFADGIPSTTFIALDLLTKTPNKQ
jgi:hypothetical protein